MSYRPHPTKGPGWWQITIEKRTTDPTTGKNKRERETIKYRGSEAEAAAMDAELNGRGKSTFPTISEILPNFLAAYQNNTSANTYAAMQTSLGHLLPYYGDMRIPMIRSHHHEEYKSTRLAGTYLPGKPGQKQKDDGPGETAKRRKTSRSTINRELACLKSLLNYAKKQGTTIGDLPDLFSKRQAQGKGIMPLAPKEISALLAQLTGTRLTLAMLMFWGGLRKKEATHLQWEDVDLNNGLMMIKGKGGGVQPVPLLGDLKNNLKKRHTKGAKGYICTNTKGEPIGNIMKALRSAALRAGITKHIDHHLLRHTCGTVLMVSGAQQRSVQGILRHASIETTSIYTHLAAQFLTDEGGKMAGLIRQQNKTRKPAKKAAS